MPKHFLVRLTQAWHLNKTIAQFFRPGVSFFEGFFSIILTPEECGEQVHDLGRIEMGFMLIYCGQNGNVTRKRMGCWCWSHNEGKNAE